MKKTIFILSGPAGVGKTTLWHEIEHDVPSIEKVITTTSRDIRMGEINGIHYHFIPREKFEQKIQLGDLIEYAMVHTNYYGSTNDELQRILKSNRCPIYIIEPQGMMHLKPILENRGYHVLTIFLLPPSLDELKSRLQKRGTETAEEFEIRLKTAMIEMKQQDFYDVKITNDDLEETKCKIIQIIHTTIGIEK